MDIAQLVSNAALYREVAATPRAAEAAPRTENRNAQTPVQTAQANTPTPVESTRVTLSAQGLALQSVSSGNVDTQQAATEFVPPTVSIQQSPAATTATAQAPQAASTATQAQPASNAATASAEESRRQTQQQDQRQASAQIQSTQPPTGFALAGAGAYSRIFSL